MSIEINGITKEETAYDKWVHFTYEGEEYHALLHWDNMDGYDLTFTDATRTANWVDTPNWADEWDEDEHDGESLEYVLDCLTDQKVEEDYLGE
jgi:hypothetical protein